MKTGATLAALALLGIATACGGGGERAEWEGLEHTPLDYVPPPDRAGDSGSGGGGAGPSPIVKLHLSNFERAVHVIGQKDFQDGARNRGLGAPTARTLDAGGPVVIRGCSCEATSSHLWVADCYNNRILRYALPLQGQGPAADIVLGQLDMTTIAASDPEVHFGGPTDVEVSGSRLFVSAVGGNRVVIYDSIPSATGDWGQVAVGQPDFTTAMRRTTVDGLRFPQGICVAGDKLFVADTGNNRVLIFNSIPTESGARADVVLGQPDFTTMDVALTASGMNRPTAVWSDGTRLLVCDSLHHRILIWSAFPARNGQPADLVLGQPDMTSTTTNQIPGIGWPHAVPHPDVFWEPQDATSNGAQIVVADSGMRRVLIWDSWPTTSHQRPDFVLGQSTFYRGHPNDDDQDGFQDPTASNRTFGYPSSVQIRGRRLYVSDNGNNRILVFQ